MYKSQTSKKKKSINILIQIHLCFIEHFINWEKLTAGWCMYGISQYYMGMFSEHKELFDN